MPLFFAFNPQGTPYQIQTGTVQVANGATVQVTFANGFAFSGPLTYGISLSLDGVAAPAADCIAFNQTTNGFQIKNLDGTARNVQWIALGV